MLTFHTANSLWLNLIHFFQFKLQLCSTCAHIGKCIWTGLFTILYWYCSCGIPDMLCYCITMPELTSLRSYESNILSFATDINSDLSQTSIRDWKKWTEIYYFHWVSYFFNHDISVCLCWFWPIYHEDANRCRGRKEYQDRLVAVLAFHLPGITITISQKALESHPGTLKRSQAVSANSC